MSMRCFCGKWPYLVVTLGIALVVSIPWRASAQTALVQAGSMARLSAISANPAIPNPLAAGLPAYPDPASVMKPWTSVLSLRDGLFYKDGVRYFPVGTVGGNWDQGFDQLQAMGCNAVHMEVALDHTDATGVIPPKALQDVRDNIEEAGQYGLACLPLMASHDIPGWFSHKYPSPVGLAIGSDGKPTGNFIPYSIHFQPYKDLLETYWRSLAPVLAAEPNVLTLNLWNEPNYGGIFSSPNVFADYSDPGIADYRAYLHKKFKDDLGAVNTALGQNYGSWDDIDPPHSVSDQGPAAWLEWTRYGQFALADFFDKERAIIKSVAPNALLANKLAAQPWDQSAASSGTNWYLDSKSEDVAGIDVYVGGPLHCRDMAEAASSESGGKPVVIYETNTMPPDAAHRTPEAVRTYLWGHVLGGADGVFVYALSRDPTYGILSDAAAGTPAREQYARFMKDVSAHQQELETHAVPTRVAIIYSTTAILLIPGITVSRSIIAADDLVQMSDVPADILSEERCTAEGLSRYSVIVLPSYTILTKPERDALDAWVAAGGKVLAFADSDTQDENLHPIDRPSWLPDTRATSSPRIQDDASRKAVVVTAHSLYSPALREVVEQALRKDIGVESPVIVGENGNADPNIMVSLRNDPDNANRRYLLLLNINTSSENVRIDLQPGWRISSEVLHGIPVTGRITVAPSEMYIFDVTRE